MKIKFPIVTTNISQEELDNEVELYGSIKSYYDSYTIVEHNDIRRIDGFSRKGNGVIDASRIFIREADYIVVLMTPEHVNSALEEADRRDSMMESVHELTILKNYKN